MNLTRFLREELIDLDLQPEFPELDPEVSEDKRLWATKEAFLKSLAEVLARSERIGNKKKLFQDLLFRERKASTAIGGGVSIPHIRTMQAKELILGVAVYRDGVEFDAADGEPVYVFCPIVTPPYEDRTYLRVVKKLAEAFRTGDTRASLLEIDRPGEVIRLLSSLR